MVLSALAQNTVGVYEVAADGTIGDVRILYDNANAVAAGACSVDLGVVEAGRRLGFFLIQDGFDLLGALPDDLAWKRSGMPGAASGPTRTSAPPATNTQAAGCWWCPAGTVKLLALGRAN